MTLYLNEVRYLTSDLSMDLSSCSPCVVGPVARATRSSWLTCIPLGGRFPFLKRSEVCFDFEPSFRIGADVGRT